MQILKSAKYSCTRFLPSGIHIHLRHSMVTHPSFYRLTNFPQSDPSIHSSQMSAQDGLVITHLAKHHVQ